MTSIERLSVAGLMALSAGIGATGAVYLRPLQPAQQQQATIAPPPTLDQPLAPMRPPVRTVSWFKAHPGEIKPVLDGCNDNLNTYDGNGECQNAADAQWKLSWEKAAGPK